MPATLAAPSDVAPARPVADNNVQVWWRRLKAARQQRDLQIRKVWKPLHTKWQGRLAAYGEDAELANAVAEFGSVLLPHLLGDRRQCHVSVKRVAAGEDFAAKQAAAEMLGDQATALAEALGWSVGRGGPSGIAQAIDDMLWGMAVILFGFSPPRGMAAARDEQDEQELPGEQPVDLDFVAAGYDEQADAGMPWIRTLDCRHVLFDHSRKDPRKAEWVAIETYLTVREARARWPQATFHGTHRSVPVWGDQEREDEEERHSGQPRMVRVYEIYQRTPRRMFVLADEEAGEDQVLENNDIEMGIEGLPLRFGGVQWVRGNPYPIPILARGYDAANWENDELLTVQQAGARAKDGTLVNAQAEPGLAAQLVEAPASGVYEVTSGQPLEALLRTFSVGGVDKDLIGLAELARTGAARASGASDMALGMREPGDQRVAEIEARTASTSSRLSGIVGPVRALEAEVYRCLMAVATAKIDLMQGLALAVGQGPVTRLVVFDANRSVVGELLDFVFDVTVSDKLTRADEVQQINLALQMIPQLQATLAAEGVGARIRPLVEEFLRKSGLPRADEVLYTLPPPPEPQQYETMPEQGAPTAAGMGAQPSAVAANSAPAADVSAFGGSQPAAPAAGPPADPSAEMAQIQEVLAQLPEGDPAEEDLIRRLAELQRMVPSA